MVNDDKWSVKIVDGPPTQEPTYSAGIKANGKKKKGKSARCLFCGFVHPLEAVKAKGEARQYEDNLLVVADTDGEGRRFLPPSNDGGGARRWKP